MRHPLRHCAAALLLGLAAPAAALAQAPPAPVRGLDDASTFAFTLENDLFSGTDRYYTNGFQFSWRSGSYDPPAWLSAATSGGPGLLFPAGGTPRWGLAFGQNKFTPSDTTRRIPDPTDRPYAAWLYGAVTLTSYTPHEYGSLELQLGLVGPGALGEQVQNGTHDLMNIDRALGWDAQIKDEPGVNLVLTRQWRQNWALDRGGLSWGVVPSIAGSLGNIQTYAAAGLALRLGTELEADFGPPRIRPSIAGSNFYLPARDWSWYVFAAAEGRAIARDITLDGNTWRDSASVDRETLVGEASAGLVLFTPWGRLTGTYTARSREFTTQRYTAQFGSVSLAIRF